MGYWDDDAMASGSAQSSTTTAGISLWVKRFMQRRKYTRLTGKSKRMQMAKLGGRKGKGISMVWRLKAVPKLKLRVIPSAAKSWMARIRETYVDMMTGFARSCTISKEPSGKKAVRDFNTKVAIEIYKSLGIQVQVCPDPPPNATRLIL